MDCGFDAAPMPLVIARGLGSDSPVSKSDQFEIGLILAEEAGHGQNKEMLVPARPAPNGESFCRSQFWDSSVANESRARERSRLRRIPDCT